MQVVNISKNFKTFKIMLSFGIYKDILKAQEQIKLTLEQCGGWGTDTYTVKDLCISFDSQKPYY